MNDIRPLLRILPPPASRYEFDGFAVETYKVKELFQPVWNHDALSEVLMAARHSYQVYGKRPLTDDPDPKSAVYIARAIYGPMEEWLSFRLVPFTGEPYGAQELDKFLCRGQTVEAMVKERLFGGAEDFGARLSASSRMCGIHPFMTEGETETGKPDLRKPLRHCYSALCYAIISKHFYEEYLSTLGIEYISGVILDKFIEGTLTQVIDRVKYGTLFVPAAEQLGVSRSEVKLDRRGYDNYAYRFPGYWFNVKQLIDLLKELIDGGQISDTALHYYLGLERPFEEIISQQLPTMEILGQLNNLGELLTIRGGIGYSKMSGEQLRGLVDARVDDAPELKLTEVGAMYASSLAFRCGASAKRVI